MTSPGDAALARAFVTGAMRALENRADALRQAAAAGSAVIEAHGKQIQVRSPEAAHALLVAADWSEIADELAKDGAP
jgi:hypothetical protein